MTLLLPVLIPAAASLLVLVAMSIRRSDAIAFALAVLGVVGGLASLPFVASELGASGGSAPVTDLLVVDAWALFFQGAILAATLGVLPMVHAWLGRRSEAREAAHVLVLLAALGAMLLATASHLGSLFLGLELLSVSLYGLIAYVRDASEGVEAGIKYLVLAAASSAFLLFGLALVYADTGAMTLQGLAAAEAGPLVAGGGVLALVGIGFKLALVPFHLWTPDVYQGAPAPVTALIATVSKAGVLAALGRLVLQTPLADRPGFVAALALLAGASMLAGNLLALWQRDVKRILAYSSIAHFGYLLVALLATTGAHPESALRAVTFYVAAYLVTILGAFGCVSLLSDRQVDAGDLASWRGLFWRHPLAAFAFTAMLLSLAGMPITAGFLGKLYLVQAGVGAASWALVALLVLGSAIGLFYYLRVVATLFAPVEGDEPAPTRSVTAWLPVAGATLLLLWLGVWPPELLVWLPG